MSARLETQGLCKSFGALPVASDINFRLDAGARHALIGPNGAGKTSFVNLVTGALKPSSGRILLDGQDITHLSQAARDRAGVEEAYALLETLGLAEDALRPVNELAYGRQRLADIAVSLGLKPAVLLLDEPAAGVPSGETGAIIDMIER